MQILFRFYAGEFIARIQRYIEVPMYFAARFEIFLITIFTDLL